MRPERSDESVKPEVEAKVAERFVVVAFVVVMLTVERCAMDDDAVDMRPAVFNMIVEVEFHEVAGVYGKAKVAAPSAESDEAPITPVEDIVAMLLVAEPIPETMRFDVDAVLNELYVEDA